MASKYSQKHSASSRLAHPVQALASIYRSRWQLVATFIFIFVPIGYLYWFTQYSNLTPIEFLPALGISFIRLIISYIISVVLAWVIAITVYRGWRATVALPLFDVLQSLPTFAALPFAVLVWGKTNFTVIVFLTLTIIWPIFFSIVSALKRTNQEWRDVVIITNLSRWQYLVKFIWPISVPGIITGSIIGLGEGWEALVATEIIVNTPDGLGQFFQGVSNQPSITALGILGLLLLIFSFNKIVWLPLLEASHRNINS